jgi:hypothetical protein
MGIRALIIEEPMGTGSKMRGWVIREHLGHAQGKAGRKKRE